MHTGTGIARIWGVLIVALGCVWMMPCSAWAETPDPVKASTPLTIPDNEVYLITPGLYRILERFRAGENFEPLPLLEEELKRTPYIPSTHYWVAARKMMLYMMDRAHHPIGDEIARHYEDCIVRAKRARKVKTFDHAGRFYEAVCSGGLASVYSMKKHYAKAGLLARASIQGFVDFLKLRPDHDGTMLAVGSYNYYTSQLGTLGKVLLGLLGLPTGDREKGLKMLTRVARPGSPLDVAAHMMLAAALTQYEKRKDEALEVSRRLVRLVPMSSNVHLSLANQYLLWGEFDASRKTLEDARRCLPEHPTESKLAEVRAKGHILVALEAMLDVLTRQDANALQRLHDYTDVKTHGYQWMVLLADIYLGHAYKLAGLDDEARRHYRKAMETEGARQVRDMAGGFLEGEDIRKQIPLAEEQREKLRAWLESRPLAQK